MWAAPSLPSLIMLWMFLLSLLTFGLATCKVTCPFSIANTARYTYDSVNHSSDVVFMVHNTDKTGEDNFALIKKALQDLETNLKSTLPFAHAIGIITYSDMARIEHRFYSYLETIDFESIVMKNRGSNITDALRMMREDMFEDEDKNNNRYGPNLAVLVTTQPPDNMSSVLHEAEEVRRAAVSVIVVALGDLRKEDFDGIASNRDCIIVGSFEKMNQTLSDVERLIHSASVPLRFDHCSQMNLDVAIVLDIGDKNLAATTAAIQLYISELDLAYTSIALMTGASEIWLYLQDGQSLDQIRQALGSLTLQDERSSFGDFLRAAKEYVFTSKKGDRLGRHDMIIVITDREEILGEVDVLAAQYLHQSGIHVQVLVIGTVQDDLLRHIASDQEGLWKVENGSALSRGLQSLHHQLCPPTCDRYNIYHNGLCYYYNNRLRRTWLEARDLCSSRRYSLASIPSQAEDEFIKERFVNSQPVYIGLRKYSFGQTTFKGQFLWEDGRPLLYNNWAGNTSSTTEPDGGLYELCTAVREGGWYDMGCASSLQAGVLCESSARNHSRSYKVLQLLSHADYLNKTGQLTFQCDNRELISAHSVCNGLSDCKDGSDEHMCKPDCSQHQFACDNGRCVSSSLYCDFMNDCGDNSDERSCVFPPCSIDEFRCQNGKCIPSKYVCDLFNDCQDWSDERSCEGLCQQFQCYDGTCLPMHWVKDGMVDCPGVNKEDELGAKRHHICDFKRSSPIYWWFTADDSRKYCKRVPDGFGKYLSAPSTIEPCDERECLVDEFQCGDGACIFAENVCDGTRDCKEGEDEHVCDAYSCPFFFRCSQSRVCLSPDKICDGHFQCPLGDDERHCHMTCPSKAECKGTSVKLNDFSMTSLHYHTRELDMTGVYIPQLTDFPTMPFLMRLCLSQCGLKVIPDVTSTLTNLLYLDVSHNILASLPGRVFRSLEQLIELNISGNKFDRINPEGFKGLGRLVSLDISECRIAKLTYKTFQYTKALRKLFLRDNVIDFIENNAFDGLTYLMDLDLSGNPVVQFSERVFSGLNSLTYLSTDNYLLCCSKVRPSTIEDNKCEAPVNSLSSCKDLMHRDILRAFLWILGILALLGNVCVIVYRIVVNRRSTTNGCDFFIVNLGFSDLLMGMYMMIIAGADVRYRGVYVWNDYEWRNSALCKVAGVLATLSSEASVVFVCLITLDRFLVIKFPFRQVRLNRICIWILVVGTWVLAIFLSVIPLFPSLRGWNFYGRNGACLALPLSKERLAGWEYSVSIFIAVNFVIFVLIAIGQWTVYSSIKEGSFLKGKERRQQDLRIAKKLFFVAMTDFMCWFPVCIMGIVALSGTSIQGEVYAWTAVFILPINSALNPILYTLPSITRQRAAGTMKTGSRPRAVVYDVNTRTSISDATEMTSESRNL